VPLTFAALNTLLTPANGSLQVTADQLGTGPAAGLLANWFSGGMLSLSAASATPDSTAGTVTITGTVAAGSFLGLQQAAVSSAAFSLAGDGTVAARIVITAGDAGWALPSSFPALAGSVFASLSYANPVFTLDSADTAPLPAGTRAQFGFPDADPVDGQLLPDLSFGASVDLAGQLASTLTDLVGTPVALAGPIRAYQDASAGQGTGPVLYPQMLLTPADGTSTRPVTVAGQNFGVAIQLACLLTTSAAATSDAAAAAAPSTGSGNGNSAAAPVTVHPVAALLADWTGTGSLPPVTLRGLLAGPAADTLVLDTGTAPLTLVGTAELPGLLGGVDPGALLDPGHGFPAYGGLQLQRAAVTLGLAPLTLGGVDVQLALTATAGGPDPAWTILGGLLAVHQLEFGVEASRDADGALHPAAAITGTAGLGQGPAATLAATVGLPGLAVTADLAENSPADLTRLVQDQFGIKLPLPEITSVDLDLTGDVPAQTWTLDVQLTQTWVLLGSGPDEVSLGDIALHLAGAPGSAVTGGLTAGMEVGGAALTATGGYAPDAGWTVQAALSDGSQADLASVATTLAAAAGVPITATLPDVTLSTFSVGYTETGRTLSVTAGFAGTGATLLQQLGQALGAPGLPAIGLSQLTGSLAETAGGTAITLHLAATDWSVPLGPSTLTVTSVALDMTRTPQASGTQDPPAASTQDGPASGGTQDSVPAPGTTVALTGTLALAGVSATVTASLPGSLTVTGSFPAVALADLVSALSGGNVTVPSVLDVTLPASTLTLTEDGGDFQLAWHTAASPLGEMSLEVQRRPQAGWGVAAGFALPAGWQLSSLSPALATLDGLSFDSAALVLSSFADPTFGFTDLPLPSLSTGVVQGLTFGCALSLSGVLAGVAAMIGETSVDVIAVIGPDPAAIKLTAALTGTVAIPPVSNLLLGDVALSIAPDPLSVSLSGQLTIPVGMQSLVATGRFTVTETAADFALDVTGSALSMVAPMGFRGIVLDEIGVVAGITFEPPGLNLGLSGTFHLGGGPAGSDTFAFAFTVEGEAVTPTLLSGHLDQLDLPTLFDACMLPTVTLPAGLDQVSFSDLTLYWCDTEQPLPDGSTAQPGFGLSGAMAVFGWNAAVKLVLDFGSGVTGDASADPVNLGGGALTLTGTGITGGPFLHVDTTASPYLSVSLNATLLDVAGEDISGTLSSSGMTFALDNHLGTLDANLAITASPSGASLTSGLNVALDVVAGPLDIPGSNLTLGSIRVQAAFTGSTTFTLSAAGFHATIDGGFSWQGQQFQLATVTLTQSPASVAALGQAVGQAVQAQAQTLFGELLSDSSQYFALVSAGLVSGASDAATLALSVYHLTPDEAQALFRSVNLVSSGTVHTDVAAGHIDTAPHTDVASGHVDTPGVHADTPGAHTDLVATHADVPGSHVDSASHVDVPGTHSDFSLFGKHADNSVTPHGDTAPHVDNSITPHADTSTPHADYAPHVDLATIPHGDTDSPHVDAAPHTDATPHTDTSVHVDT
jgi:hypothetical protein